MKEAPGSPKIKHRSLKVFERATTIFIAAQMILARNAAARKLGETLKKEVGSNDSSTP